MASISKVVKISVSLLTAGVKEAGFGIPMICDYHNRFSERIRFYADLDEMTGDGFVPADAAYQAAAAVFAQQPSVEEVAVGRRLLAPSLKVNIAPTLQIGKHYKLAVTDPVGIEHDIDYNCTTDRSLNFTAQSANFTIGDVITGGSSGAKGTLVSQTDAGTTGTLRLSGVTGTFGASEALTDQHTGAATTSGADIAYETLATVVAGLVALLDVVTGLAATDHASAHTSVDVMGEVSSSYFGIKVVEDGVAAGFANLLVMQTHIDPGIATDLAAIRAVDDSWYGFTLTTLGKLEINAASAWAESNDKQMSQGSQDGDILAATAGNIMLLCQTANRFRTGLLFHENPVQHIGAAWLGSVFPIDPGAVTYAFRQLRNVDKSPLNSTQMTNIENANGNYFVDIGGNGVTFGKNGGGMASSGEYMDIIRDTDWYEVQIGVEHMRVKLNNNKVPMTNVGIAMEAQALRTATRRAEQAGFLDETTTVYTVPDISAIPANKRAARTLDRLKVSSRVQGAIHITEVVATITS